MLSADLSACLDELIQNMLDVVVDNLLSVFHATVTDLDGIAVEDFSELVIFREVFVYKGKESVSQLKCILWLEENVSQLPRVN